MKCGAPTIWQSSDALYLDTVAGVFCWCLNHHEIHWVFTKGPWGELEKKKIDFPFCRKKVYECWEAAPLTPSWGNRYMVTCRLLMARYHESGLDDKAIHINEDTWSEDRGALQINSIHWFKTGRDGTAFETFCKEQHIPAGQIGLLDIGWFNVKFGAWLNERFIKSHQRRFHYQDTLFEWAVYHKMLAVNPGPWALPMDRAILGKNEVRK